VTEQDPSIEQERPKRDPQEIARSAVAWDLGAYLGMADHAARRLRGAVDARSPAMAARAVSDLQRAVGGLGTTLAAAHAHGVKGGVCCDAIFVLAAAEAELTSARKRLACQRPRPERTPGLLRPLVSARVHRRGARRRGAGRPGGRSAARAGGGDSSDDPHDGPGPAGVGGAIAGARRRPA
jgi:hypothetical protein